jgi:alkylmercury lyase
MTRPVPAPDLYDDTDLSEPVARAVRRIAVLGFAALWAGRSATLAELLGEHGTELNEATEHLRRRGRIELSPDGVLIGVHGLCRRTTPHRIEHKDDVVNTWCAFDAIGIPAALRIDARATTQCPTCKTPLAVRLDAGAPEPVRKFALWYPQSTCGHLVEDFCSDANLFCTTEHLDRWARDTRAVGRVMTIDDAAELGRECWADATPIRGR